jgi:sigma-54-interacting transcriptional regulator/regulatory Fis family protein
MMSMSVYHVLFIAYSIFLFFKLCIVSPSLLKFKPSKSSPAFYSWLFFITFVISASFVDFAWIIKSIKSTIFPDLDYRTGLFFLRIAWGCMALQYQALTLFINSLLRKNYKLGVLDLLLAIGNISMFLYFIGIAVFQFNCPTPQDRSTTELMLQKVSFMYVLLVLTFSTLISAIRIMRADCLPRILRNQLKTFLGLLVVPCIVSETIQVYPFTFPLSWATRNLTMATITALLLTYMMYHCMRKVMGLRLFNAQTQVDLGVPIVVPKDLKRAITKIESLKSVYEIHHVVQNFFKEIFHIPTEKTHFYLCHVDSFGNEQAIHERSHDEKTVEDFISKHAMLLKNKILVTDEVEFSNAYEENEVYKAEIALLHALNADIFIPIYEQHTMSAYIIIERDARKDCGTNGLYDCSEQDQMQILAGALGNTITALARNELRKLEREIKHLDKKNQELCQEIKMLHQEHQKQEEKREQQFERQYQENTKLRNELSHRLHEIDKYREGISQFIFHDKQEREFGIIFYKTPHFKFGNPQAEKFLSSINLNKHAGHGITKTLNDLVQRVLDYRVPQQIMAKNDQGETLAFIAISNIEHGHAKNHAIIIVSRPEISDLIKQKLTSLRDLSHWDYLFYLESTKTGGLVNDLIPGSGPALLNFKIDLLKMAFSKKALMLMVPSDDIMPMAEIIHDISLRAGALQQLILKEPEKGSATAAKLFGAKTLFDVSERTPTTKTSEQTTQELSIFERFQDRSGTVLIENIQYLSTQTQEALAGYLKTGTYYPIASQQRKSCLARILCTAPVDLHRLVEEKKFSKALFQELEPTMLVMPSLLTLPEEEFCELACDLSSQAIKDPAFKQVLELTDRDTKKMLAARPASLASLRKKVQSLLQTKASKQDLTVDIDPAFDADPELMHAARLGPDAVKDPQILAKVLKKFNGNENQVALFLGVNRSTINRRLKEFGLSKVVY